MAAALVGGAFLSAFLQVLFDRIASRDFLKLFQTRKVDHELLKKLKTNLLTVGAVLDDAENKETRNQAVKEWLEELHETVYEADDLLDQINTEALRVKVETEYQSSSITGQVSSTVFATYNSDQFLEGIMPEIEKIVVRLDGFIQQIVPLGLQNVESKIKSYRTPSISLVDETTLYGRDVAKEKIIQMLLSEDANGDNNFTVVSIVGLGGIGKTTLAQLVYDDKKVKNHFPTTKAWVCVSEDYDANRMTKELLKELKIEFSDSSESLNSLQVKLQRGLIDKKFLLVLDDVWNRQYSDWNKLKMLFQDGSKGSKIIVTTRDEKIARMMGQERSIHRLDIISKKDSWSLFEKHAFGDGDNENREELEEIGKKIVSKCKGLPLAVKTVAGLLRSTRMVEEWKDILENDLWNQTNNPDDILPALKLSYVHLPSHLKRCFAYCAVFHKDFMFTKDQIIQLWHANGLLEHRRNDTRIEHKGEEYLHELRSRSLLQQSTDCNHLSMHDLINDLAKSIFGKFCLKLEDHDSRHGTVARVRNFTYNPRRNDTFDKFKLLRETENLTTFLPLYSSIGGRISNKFLHDMLPRFKSLRVLSLAGYDITKLPDSFIGLKQLRFLNLSFTNITKLPEWVCTLYNLQTLLLSNCAKLEELSIHLLKLINLCYLDISGTRLNKMPTQMGRLKNLQVLTGFVVGKDGGSGIQELGQFQKLSGKQLFISGLENVSCGRDASMANVKGMKHLEHLTLKWNGDAEGSQVARDVFDELQPHSGIKHLEINGYCGTRLPDWFGNPLFCHMKSLSLYNCQYCFVLPPLGQLPSLESLEIVGMSKVLALSREMYCGDSCEIKPFLSLKKLKIQNMEELERWDIPECETFCNIEELNITNCPRLVGKLPTNLSSLEILKISECDKLDLPNGQLGIFNGDIQQFLSLHSLKVSGLQNLKELYPGPDSLPSLEVLEIKNCKSLLPFRLGDLPAALKRLEYDGCVSNLELQLLEGESSRGGTLIDWLKLRNLDSLKVASLGSFPRLRVVQISECKMLSFGIPEGGLPAPNLTYLSLSNCEKLKSLPERMQSLLPSLRRLLIQFCPEIECFPEGGLPSSLEYLFINNCKKLMSSSRVWDLPRLPSLIDLRIGGVDDESFPNEDLLLPRTLVCLYLRNHRNLKMLNYSGLRHLTCLNTLTIGSCRKIQSLLDEGLPASLTTLEIRVCPLLKPRLEWEKGQDWHKVAHIPCVVVDGELFP